MVSGLDHGLHPPPYLGSRPETADGTVAYFALLRLAEEEYEMFRLGGGLTRASARRIVGPGLDADGRRATKEVREWISVES